MSHPRSTALLTALADWLVNVNLAVAEAAARGVQLTPALARQSLAGVTQMFGGQGPELPDVHDFTLPECPDILLRSYDPAPGRPGPLVVYLHGGGHVAGSIAVYDPIIRRVAQHTGCRTIAIDYRLAPEHPYPQGLDDCAAVVRALSAVPGTPGLIVAGDSGGGALAASLSAQSITDPTLHILGQILIYPSLDYTLSQPSIQTLARGYLLEAGRIRWYFDHYFRNNENRQAASPLFMPVKGLPSTLLLTAGFCPLRDEGYAYAEQLKTADVACQHVNLPDMIHAWLNIHTLIPDACDHAYRVMGDWVRKTGA